MWYSRVLDIIIIIIIIECDQTGWTNLELLQVNDACVHACV
jgi:hypothetical protein